MSAFRAVRNSLASAALSTRWGALTGVVVLLVQIDTVGVEIGNEIKQLHEAARGKGRKIASACRETSFRAEAHQITSKVRLPRIGRVRNCRGKTNFTSSRCRELVPMRNMCGGVHCHRSAQGHRLMAAVAQQLVVKGCDVTVTPGQYRRMSCRLVHSNPATAIVRRSPCKNSPWEGVGCVFCWSRLSSWPGPLVPNALTMSRSTSSMKRPPSTSLTIRECSPPRRWSLRNLP